MISPKRWPWLFALLLAPALWVAGRPAAVALGASQLRTLGAQLLADASAEFAVRHLVVNGQRLVVRRGQAQETLPAWLAARRAACERQAGGDGGSRGIVTQPSFLGDQSGGEGFAMCLVLSPRLGGLSGVVASVSDFLRSREVELVERLTYVYARESRAGVAFVQLEGERINPLAFAAPPAQVPGDAVEAADLPAPIDGDLSFLVAEEGKPYGFSVYTGGRLPVQRTLGDLRLRLIERGFEVNLLSPEHEGGQAARLWARRGDLWALIVAFEDRRGVTTAFAIADAAVTPPAGGSAAASRVTGSRAP